MKKSQSGFTLIELVVVIVLLGILGVTALGRFQDLSGQAQDAANAGIAGELTAASTLNFAARSLLVNNATNTAILVATTCDAAATALMTIRPPGYTFRATTPAAPCTGPGTVTSCEVIHTAAPVGTAAPASLICIN